MVCERLPFTDRLTLLETHCCHSRTKTVLIIMSLTNNYHKMTYSFPTIVFVLSPIFIGLILSETGSVVLPQDTLVVCNPFSSADFMDACPFAFPGMRVHRKASD